MNLAAIRSELAAAIRTGAFGLHVYDVVQASPELPAAHIGPPVSIDYHREYAGERQVRCRVLLEVSRADPYAAQRKLDELLSWPGVASVIEQHTGVNWSSLVVEAVGEARAAGDEHAPTLAVDLTVRINTTT